jgi:hypothetical protein
MSTQGYLPAKDLHTCNYQMGQVMTPQPRNGREVASVLLESLKNYNCPIIYGQSGNLTIHLLGLDHVQQDELRAKIKSKKQHTQRFYKWIPTFSKFE